MELLADPDKPHLLIDDLQSVYWALVYGGLHFVEHLDRNFLIGNDIFNSWKESSAGNAVRVTGGDLKLSTLLTGGLERLSFVCEPFGQLIRDLSQLWRKYVVSVTFANDTHNQQSSDLELHEQLSSPEWLASKLDDAINRNVEKWLRHDIVPDQFPPMTANDRRRHINQLITNTFDQSHLAILSTGACLAQHVHGMEITGTEGPTSAKSDKLAKKPIDFSDDPLDNEYKETPTRSHKLSKKNKATRHPTRRQPARRSKNHRMQQPQENRR